MDQKTFLGFPLSEDDGPEFPVQIIEAPCGCDGCTEAGASQPGHPGCSPSPATLLVAESIGVAERIYAAGAWRWILRPPPDVPLWSYHRDRFPGLSDEALEVIRKATAGERHAHRVSEAARRTADFAVELVGTDPHTIRGGALSLAMSFVVLLEDHGLGGSLGVGGGSTRRLPCFEDCGKGRKQATDGPAWDAAIAEAARPLGDRMTLVVDDEGEDNTPLTLTLSDGVERDGLPPDTALCEIALAAIPWEWRAALARRAVLVLSGTMPRDLARPEIDRLFFEHRWLAVEDHGLAGGRWARETPEGALVAWGRVLSAAVEDGHRAARAERDLEDLRRALKILDIEAEEHNKQHAAWNAGLHDLDDAPAALAEIPAEIVAEARRRLDAGGGDRWRYYELDDQLMPPSGGGPFPTGEAAVWLAASGIHPAEIPAGSEEAA